MPSKQQSDAARELQKLRKQRGPKGVSRYKCLWCGDELTASDVREHQKFCVAGQPGRRKS